MGESGAVIRNPGPSSLVRETHEKVVSSEMTYLYAGLQPLRGLSANDQWIENAVPTPGA